MASAGSNRVLRTGRGMTKVEARLPEPRHTRTRLTSAIPRPRTAADSCPSGVEVLACVASRP
jgi:hypothetical protein